MKIEMLQPLRGIVPPVVTPLDARGALDVESLQRVIENLIAGGVHGLFMLGTTGEGPSLSVETRQAVVRESCRIVDKRIPVLVGVTDSSLDEGLSLVSFAADAGADAAVAAPPYYFPVEQRDLCGFFLQLSGESPLPLVLYNMPALTGSSIAPETVARLIEVESIVGLKDSSGDLDYFKRVLEVTAARPDFPVLVGPEGLIAETLALGGAGGVPGGANIWPQPFVEAYEAHFVGDAERVKAAAAKIDELGQIYSLAPKSIPAIVARIKYGTSLVGLCQPFTAPPIPEVEADLQSKIEVILQQLGVLQAEADTPQPPISAKPQR